MIAAGKCTTFVPGCTFVVLTIKGRGGMTFGCKELNVFKLFALNLRIPRLYYLFPLKGKIFGDFMWWFTLV